MSYTLTENDTAMLRAAAGQLDTAGVQNLEAAVANRLTALLDSGVATHITKNHVRAAITAELAK